VLVGVLSIESGGRVMCLSSYQLAAGFFFAIGCALAALRLALQPRQEIAHERAEGDWPALPADFRAARTAGDDLSTDPHFTGDMP
jgi:hypothetical protein